MQDSPRREDDSTSTGSLWVFDVLVGVALGLIVAGIVVAGQTGTAVRMLREHIGSMGLPRGWAGIAGVALAVAVVVAAVAVAALVARIRSRAEDRASSHSA